MNAQRYVLAAVVLLVALAAATPARRAAAASDTAGGLAFHPFTLESCTTPVPDSHGRGDCDPVNLVVPDATWQEVRDALLAAGWTTVGIGGTQYLHFETDDLAPMATQLYYSDGPSTRYHVRLWDGPGSSVAAAVHHEAGTLQHTIDMDWDGAEAFLAAALCPTRFCSQAFLPQQSSRQGDDGEWRGWANDANATIVRFHPPPLARNQLSAISGGASWQLFGRSTTGGLWWYDSAQPTPAWAPVVASGAAGGPVAIAQGGATFVFYRGSGGDLRYAQRSDGGWSDHSLGGLISGDPAVAADGSGDLVVVVGGASGGLWYRRLPSGSGTWDAWAGMDGAFPGGVMTLAAHGGDLFLFGLDAAKGAWTRTWDDPADTWGGWTRLGGYIESIELHAVSHGGALSLFALGGGGSLYQRSFDGSWSGWGALDGALSGAVAAASTSSGIVIAGPNGNGSSWARTGAGATWGAWDALGGVIATTPELAGLSDGAVYFGQDATGGAWYRRRTGGAWGPWTSLGGSFAVGP